MKARIFPTSASEAVAWAKAHGEAEELATRRWIKFAALDCLARDEALTKSIIVRGSLALSFYDPNNRLAEDIDIYSEPLTFNTGDDFIADLTSRFNKAIHTWMPSHFPNLDRWSTRIKNEVKLEIAPVEYIVHWNQARLPSPSNRKLRIASLECLVAEKLLAMLRHSWEVQEGKISKPRSKDVLDLYRVLQLRNHPLDIEKIIHQFNVRIVLKDRPITLKRSSFEATEPLAARFYVGKTHERAPEIPFQQAWAALLTLVNVIEKKNAS